MNDDLRGPVEPVVATDVADDATEGPRAVGETLPIDADQRAVIEPGEVGKSLVDPVLA